MGKRHLARAGSAGGGVGLTFKPSEYQVNLPVGVQQLAEEFGSDMMDSNELLHLAATLAEFPWTADAIVVEIGTFVGNTTVFMAKALQLLGKQAHILSIDPFERARADPFNPRGSYSAYLNNIHRNKLENTCLPLVGFSYDAAPLVPDRIGLLVVDGAHHYPVVKKDLELYCPKVLPRGFVFIDDYVPSYPDVMRAVDEYFALDSPFDVLNKTYFVIARRK
jgi:hypothetical protein